MPTHGATKTPMFTMWSGIKGRCFGENSPSWKRYGGRGITMYGPWIDDFEAFREYVAQHLGAKPSDGHSIDRIENDGSYEPGNIRWATSAQQARNRSTTKLDDWDVLFIRHWHSVGFKQADVAKVFNVRRSYVSQIVNGYRRTLP
jgi:hypothetical protein